jgi:serine/threonine protein kinase
MGWDFVNSQSMTLAKLASGTIADVYLCAQFEDGQVDSYQIVKQIHAWWMPDNQSRQRLLDGVQRVFGLKHPNIVELYEVQQIHKNISISMEYVDGETLHTIMGILAKKEETMPIGVACGLVIQAAEALYAARVFNAQDTPLVHGHIDGNSLMLAKDGRVRIVDFGLPKHGGHSKETIDKQRLFDAPEIKYGVGEDERVDLYSLGLVFYWFLTGREPVSRDDRIPSLTPLDGSIPEDMGAIVAKAIQTQVDLRYPTGLALADAIYQSNTQVADTEEIAWWFCTRFARRIALRREYEQMLIEKVVSGYNAPVSDEFYLLSDEQISREDAHRAELLSRVSGVQDVVQDAVQEEPRHFNLLVVICLVFAFTAAAMIAYHQVFWKGPDPGATRGNEQDPLAALATLPEDLREVMFLHHLKGMTIVQIARVMEFSQEEVQRLLQMGLRRLADDSKWRLRLKTKPSLE